MQPVCRNCPKGYYCKSSIKDLTKCPAHHFCPEKTRVPILCPNGTYTNYTATGLGSAGDCQRCPTSYYCKTGMFGI